MELWLILWSAPEQTVEWTIETPVIWEKNRAHYDVYSNGFLIIQMLVSYKYGMNSVISHDDVIKWKHFLRNWPFDQWIPRTKASDTELWCILWSAPEQTVEWTIETPVIWEKNRAHYDVYSNGFLIIQMLVSYKCWFRMNPVINHDDVIKWKHFLRNWPFDQWIPRTKASDTELWCILWSAPEQTVEWTIETLVIWEKIVLIMLL